MSENDRAREVVAGTARGERPSDIRKISEINRLISAGLVVSSG
jgi:hypothetical protein